MYSISVATITDSISVATITDRPVGYEICFGFSVNTYNNKGYYYFTTTRRLFTGSNVPLILGSCHVVFNNYQVESCNYKLTVDFYNKKILLTRDAQLYLQI